MQGAWNPAVSAGASQKPDDDAPPGERGPDPGLTSE